MRILIVDHPRDEKFIINVEKTDTLSRVKQLIDEECSIPPEYQRLYLQGKKISIDSIGIELLDITNDCVLHLDTDYNYFVKADSIDYCSIFPPDKAPGESRVPVKTMVFNVGKKKRLTLFYHPGCPQKIINWVAGIETGDITDYDNAAQLERFSRDALLKIAKTKLKN